jgi:gas vesicle structural protein
MSLIPTAGSGLEGPSGGNISDVVGLILDKGLVIDIYVRVSLIGIEILTIDARVVVASVDTYLRFAEAAGRLNLEDSKRPGLPDVIQGVTGSLTGAVGQATAALAPAQDAAAVPAASVGQGAGAGQHDGDGENAPVSPWSKRPSPFSNREKESRR